MSSIKKIIKKYLPENIFGLYHLCLAHLASFYYGFPSRKMVIIGVTGTKGKTSTSTFMWACLRAGGYKVGLVSTAVVRIGDEEFLNPYHMTMPGRFVLHELLKRMVDAGCTHCIVETTSEGIKQSRHRGIEYDVAVFTNLFPEHLPSHGGSFEKYKQTKALLFASLKDSRKKKVAGNEVPKIIVVNSDSEHGEYFLDFWADRKITFGLKEGANYVAKNLQVTGESVGFSIGSEVFTLNLPGSFNIYNALPAIVVSHALGVSASDIRRGLESVDIIPGRMERIVEGQPFRVFVDYAHEKQSMSLLMEAAHTMQKDKNQKIIVILGAEGGGRDKSKRPVMGEIAGSEADYVIVSNVDPYEDDPKEILEDIAKGAIKGGKVRDKDLFVIEDRRKGIQKALNLAKEGDIVLLTGKGAEQSMIIGGKSIPWDDRTIVREELNLLKKNK